MNNKEFAAQSKGEQMYELVEKLCHLTEVGDLIPMESHSNSNSGGVRFQYKGKGFSMQIAFDPIFDEEQPEVGIYVDETNMPGR